MSEFETLFAVGALLLRGAQIGAATALCWFGYRLFARSRAPSSAELSLGGWLRVHLVQVGPGAFFSLFGAAVLLYGIHRPPELHLRDGAGTRQVAVAGAAPAAAPDADRAAQSRAAQQIAWLNRVRVDGGVNDPVDVADAARLSRDIRLALMRGVWRSEWGDAAAFERWARDPAGRAPSAEAQSVYERR